MTEESPSPLVNRRERSALSCAIFLVAALLQFCLCLNHRDITNAHEGRTAQTSREMLARQQWVVPYCNGNPRLAKPPLMYWMTDIAWTITGAAEPWSARLPPAMCGAIAVLLVMDLTRRTLGRDAAFCAGLIWITTWFVADEYRKAMADPYLAFFTLLSIWAWIRADLAATPGQNEAVPRAVSPRTVGFIVLAYASIALAALAKGHLILIHLAVALIPYHLLRRTRPRPLKIHLLGTILCLIIASAWPAYIFLTVPGAWNIWRIDLLASEASSGERFASILTYPGLLPMTAAPWTVFALIGAIVPLIAKGRHDRRALWPLLWLVTTVVVFTLVPMKKATYILPAMPAQTMLAAFAMANVLRWPRRAKDVKGERFLMSAHLIAAIITVGVCVGLLLDMDRFGIERPMPMVIGIVLSAGLLIAIGLKKPNFRSRGAVVALAALFGVCVNIAECWLVPEELNKRSSAPFARRITRETGDAPLRVIGPGLREDILFYLGGRIVPKTEKFAQLPADYRGFAIVTPNEYEAVLASGRGEELAASPDRKDDTRLHFFSFANAPATAPATTPSIAPATTQSAR